MEYQSVLHLVDYLGIFAFSISGAMVAIEEEVDLFGVLFLGLVTALGGGALRDTLLGALPSANFYHFGGIALSLATSSLVFLGAYLQRSHYFARADKVARLNTAIDAIGLGLFSVYGVQATRVAGFADNVFLTIFMGMLTGVGGGLLRDIIVMRKPVILTKHIYAVASIVGASCYFLLSSLGLGEAVSVGLSVALVFAIRMVSVRYRINLPKVTPPS